MSEPKLVVENECIAYEGRLYSYSIVNKGRLDIKNFYTKAYQLFENMQESLRSYGTQFFTNATSQVQLIYPKENPIERELHHIFCEMTVCDWKNIHAWYIRDVVEATSKQFTLFKEKKSDWEISTVDSLLIHNYLFSTIPTTINSDIVSNYSNGCETNKGDMSDLIKVLNGMCLDDLLRVSEISPRMSKIARMEFKHQTNFKIEMANKLQSYPYSDMFGRLLWTFGDLLTDMNICGRTEKDVLYKIRNYVSHTRGNIHSFYLNRIEFTKEIIIELERMFEYAERVCMRKCKNKLCSNNDFDFMFYPREKLKYLEIEDCATTIYRVLENRFTALTTFKMQSGLLLKSCTYIPSLQILSRNSCNS